MRNHVVFRTELTKSVMLIEDTAQENKQSTEAFQSNMDGQMITRFPCEHMGKQDLCQLCQGYGFLTENSRFSKFVEAIVNFKLGVMPASSSIQPQPQTTSRLTPTSILKPNSRPPRPQPPSTINSSTTTQSNLFYSAFLISSSVPTSSTSFHNGIQCNECHQLPIIGKRYICKTCDDYDLCEECFNGDTHQHKNFQMVMQTKSEICKAKLRRFVERGEQVKGGGGRVGMGWRG